MDSLEYASTPLVSILTSLTNSILHDGKLPPQFKIGAFATKKIKAQLHIYRCIIVTATVEKVVKKEMMQQTKPLSKAKECTPVWFYRV